MLFVVRLHAAALWLVAIGPVASSSVLAQAPDSVAGLVFDHHHRGIGFGATTYERKYLLRGDGTFQSIYAGIVEPLNIPLKIESPTHGTYTYTKTGADTATLTATPDGQSAETFSLEFTTTPWGTLWKPAPPVGGGFRFRSLPVFDPLVNTSQRAWVSATEPSILGFVVPAGRDTLVLIRAVGPGLAAFPGTTPAADPRITVYQGQTVIAENDDWETGDLARPSDALRATTIAVSTLTGAFPLQAGSKDAAIVLLLNPGNYTVHVHTAAGEPRAEVLGEIYVGL